MDTCLFIVVVIMGVKVMADLSRITAEVSEISTVAGSAIALLDQIAQQLRENATDPAAINALADQLDASGNALADAITRNTPAA